MTDTVKATGQHVAVAGKLSTLDRFLPVWIGVAMAAGLILGRLIPGLNKTISAVTVDGISLPIAIGLLIMMYPVLAKVRYDRLDTVTGDRKLLISSLLLNWILGPLVMFTPRLADASGPARIPHRSDHRRSRQMHCHGDYLE